jgi:ubiquinone/menaquinone biosynthesis C-methylase UbiE
VPHPGGDMQPARLGDTEVVATYERLAPRYDLWAALTESRARRRCLELASVRNGETVLEVAAGTGLLFTELLNLNPDGVTEGVDLTEAMLTKARRRAVRLGAGSYRLLVGDARHLDYPADRFDLLINNYMFDLLPEPDFATILGEFMRVLRPGGRLVLANMTKPEHWYQALWEGLYRLKPSLMGGCRGVRLLPFVEAAGFQDLRPEVISQMTFPTEVIGGVKPRR